MRNLKKTVKYYSKKQELYLNLMMKSLQSLFPGDVVCMCQTVCERTGKVGKGDCITETGCEVKPHQY